MMKSMPLRLLPSPSLPSPLQTLDDVYLFFFTFQFFLWTRELPDYTLALRWGLDGFNCS
jgi:hypothetical protein